VALLFSLMPCLGLVAVLVGALACLFALIGFFQAGDSSSEVGKALAGLAFGLVACGMAVLWRFAISRPH
jgi:hypothetical protein